MIRLKSSVVSFGVTILFAIYNGFWGIRFLSVWHGSICIYYILLVMIRGMILLTEKENAARSIEESAHCRRKTFRISSAMLLLLNLALILPLSMLVTLEKPVNMGLIPAITMAAYTTYKIIMASIRIGKQKHSSLGNVLVAELRTINFIDALVSVLILQNTLIMVNQTKSSSGDMILLSVVSGAVIYFMILFTTVYLLMTGLKGSK